MGAISPGGKGCPFCFSKRREHDDLARKGPGVGIVGYGTGAQAHGPRDRGAEQGAGQRGARGDPTPGGTVGVASRRPFGELRRRTPLPGRAGHHPLSGRPFASVSPAPGATYGHPRRSGQPAHRARGRRALHRAHGAFGPGCPHGSGAPRQRAVGGAGGPGAPGAPHSRGLRGEKPSHLVVGNRGGAPERSGWHGRGLDLREDRGI